MNSKKGMLLVSETLKMVIALVSIGLLIYLLSMLYFSGGKEQSRQDAAALSERMRGITLNLEEGNSSQVNGLTPSDWIIFSFAGQEKRPNTCAGENCICICESKYDYGILDRQFNECNENGACYSEPDLLRNPEIKIKSGGATDIEIYRSNGRVGVKEI